MKKTVYLCVERGDSEYDYKAGFASYSKRYATARDTLQQEKRLCVYCEVRQETIFAQISKNILTWQQETINLSTCYSTGFNAIAITILTTAAETLSIVFGPMTRETNKMRELYDLLPVKPEWLTREQIDEYTARMGVK